MSFVSSQAAQRDQTSNTRATPVALKNIVWAHNNQFCKRRRSHEEKPDLTSSLRKGVGLAKKATPHKQLRGGGEPVYEREQVVWQMTSVTCNVAGSRLEHQFHACRCCV